MHAHAIIHIPATPLSPALLASCMWNLALILRGGRGARPPETRCACTWMHVAPCAGRNHQPCTAGLTPRSDQIPIFVCERSAAPACDLPCVGANIAHPTCSASPSPCPRPVPVEECSSTIISTPKSIGNSLQVLLRTSAHAIVATYWLRGAVPTRNWRETTHITGGRPQH